jgi:hypothetical protein
MGSASGPAIVAVFGSSGRIVRGKLRLAGWPWC